jgi:uncharacterized phage-associated protein
VDNRSEEGAMAANYTASLIAKWFAAWAEAEDAEVSNLKLQKLLYYAQGHHLGQYGTPLFDDPIQAWSHGPVVRDVYHELKGFGSGNVVLSEDDDFAWSQVDDETSQFLIKVWNTYGPVAAWRLRNMTHATGPWKRHFTPEERFIVIPQSEIREYFAAVAPAAS